MAGLAAVAALVMIAAAVTQFIAWVGAVINTAGLKDKTWFIILLVTGLSASVQAAEMDRATAEQVSLTGVQPCGFRPPGGNYNSTTLSLAQQRRMKFWTWSVDTEDWKAKGSASAYWVSRIITLAEKGGSLAHPVVLMHNQPAGNPATVLALPAIIQYFASHGYTFTDLAGRIRAPRTGDYNGDGRTDLAVWRPASGTWYVRGVATTSWGASGDVPVTR